MIYDSCHLKNDRKIKKVSLLFIGEEYRLCDCCDEKAKCASIKMIVSGVMVICKSCLDKISFEFYSESEKRDIIIDKILNDG
jgi:hypothetical protein